MAPIPVSTLINQDGLEPEARSILSQPPFEELAFVPADVDLVARVDLGAMVAEQPDALRRLDFLLHAQQPAAWELLGAADLALGRDITSIYLVLRGEEALIGAVGHIDEAKLNAALAAETHHEAVPVANGTFFEWAKASAREIGGHDPGDERVGPIAMGVENGILLLGAPDLVRRALEVRAGHGRDVRRSPLAREIAPAPAKAMAWAALRTDREAGVTLAGAFAPGLVSARLHAIPPAIEVRASFKTADEARAFQGQLGGLLQLGAKLAGETPIGETLERLRSEAKIAVEGAEVRLSARI